jgi:hypothetical protein
MILAHCIVAFVFVIAGLLCFGAGCMALYLRGRYWGMIWLMSSTGVLSASMMVYLKIQDILNQRDGGNALFWLAHDMVQGAFVMVCAMTAIIYLIHWRPPSERH